MRSTVDWTELSVNKFGDTKMRILLTSFGISESLFRTEDSFPGAFRLSPEDRPWAHVHGVSVNRSLFDRMPPVDMRSIPNLFLPDYASLLLAEQILMDQESFRSLQSAAHPLFSKLADALGALHEAGHITLVDYQGALQRDRELLENMLELDMRILDEWVPPLRESLEKWRGFARNAERLLGEAEIAESGHYGGTDANLLHWTINFADGVCSDSDRLLAEALNSSRNRRKRKYRDVLRSTLRPYLRYVNCNLVLARQFSAGLHDWSDFLPFYHRKFAPVGQRTAGLESHTAELLRLFSVAIPQFTISDTKQLLRVIEDKRVQELRKVVSEAVAGKVTFDEEYARQTFCEVLRISEGSQRWRRIVSYLTIPIGQIPWAGPLLQKTVEEAAGKLIDRHLERDYQWFYLLSDVNDSPESAEPCAEPDELTPS